MSVAQIAEVQELIRQVGLAPTKAKNICNMSKVCCRGCAMSNVCFCSDVLTARSIHKHLQLVSQLASAVSAVIRLNGSMTDSAIHHGINRQSQP